MTAGGTSYVRTPSNHDKGPTEHDVEEDKDEEDEDEDEEEEYNKIGMSQPGDAPFPTQFDAQVLEKTLHHIRHNYLNIVSNDAYIVIAGS